MPVYMRKRQDSLSLSQFSEASPDIDQDFVLDPDKHRDPLPQPYRFIDKVLNGLLERTFQEIFSREEEREQEQTRYKPPLVPTDLCRVVPDVQSVRFLRASSDTDDEQRAGRFVFCASEGQLLALDAVSMAIVGSFDAPGLDVAHIETAQIRAGLHLLATLDDLGLARIFLWDTAAFHLARLMNEEEGEKKINCLAVHLSADAEYMALTLLNASTQAVTLEFHRIPRDAWAKEVDQQAGRPAVADPPAAAVNKGGAIAEEAEGGNERTDDASGANAAGSDEAARVPSLKLSPLTPVLRVKQPPPAASTAGASAPNLKAVDATGEVVGSGYAHLLTQGHLQLREANFRRAHASELRHLPTEKPEESVVSLPSVLFLKPGRILGTDQTSDKDLFVSAAVSWSGDYKVLIYSLLKVGKDLEFRPDTVWTCGSAVTCLAASPCTALVAVGLESGNLLIHDARLALTRHVISLDPARPAQAIRRVFFLNPAAGAESQGQQQQVYRSVQPVRAVVCTADLTPYLAELGPDVAPTARRLPTSVRHAYEAPEFVDHPRCHPTLLARASRSGVIVLQDVRGAAAQEILQLGLPPPYQLPCPWQPGGWAIAAGGRSLFVRGRDGETGDERLFFYSLRILIPMKPYWKLRAPEAPCYAHCRIEQRADAYLQFRNATHSERQKNLADIWSNLFTTLTEVESAKAALTSADTPRSVRTLHTSLSNVSDDSKDARLKEFMQRDSMPIA